MRRRSSPRSSDMRAGLPARYQSPRREHDTDNEVHCGPRKLRPRSNGPAGCSLLRLLGGALALGIVYFVLRLSVFPPAGKLTVLTDPPGAGIIIDKAAIRISPVQDVTLSPGTHAVIASWDDVSVDTAVMILSGQPSLIVIAKASYGGPLAA